MMTRFQHVIAKAKFENRGTGPETRAFLRRIARFIVAVARSRELSFARMAVPPPGDG